MRHYGISEVAEALGVRRATVGAWLARGKMPEPDSRLAMGPVWTARRIEPWMDEWRKADAAEAADLPRRLYHAARGGAP